MQVEQASKKLVVAYSVGVDEIAQKDYRQWVENQFC